MNSPATPPPLCDAHFHVFGPAALFPPAPDALYPPPLAPLDDYLALAATLGIQRFVLVQPSLYGRDNRYLLEALHRLGPAHCRAVLDVDEEAVDDRQLAAWHAAGVRGLRLHSHKPPTPGLAEAWGRRLARLEAIVAELGWSIDLLMPGWLTAEMIPALHALKVDFTIAHMGFFRAEAGADQAGFGALLALLRETSGCRIKLTGFYRQSTAPAFADLPPFVEALVEAGPDRLLWGSDYPHVIYPGPVDTPMQLHVARRWLPDERVRAAIFGGNAAQLYGFEDQAGTRAPKSRSA